MKIVHSPRLCARQPCDRTDRTARLHPQYQSLRGRRRGIAIIWLIALAPVATLLLCLIIEAGNLWMAKVELRTSLEAAALAGVKTWADLSEADGHIAPGDFAKTSAARTAAVAAASANTFSGLPIVLGRNETNDGDSDVGYDNTSCTGDLILGGFPTTGSTEFNATAAVGCGRSMTSTQTIDVTFDIEVDTTGGTSTLDSPAAFRISFTTPQAGIFLTELVINLQNVPTSMPLWADDGVFDFGGGPFNVAAAEADGNGPTAHATSDVAIASASGDGTGLLTLTFAPGDWGTGQTLIFGVDTDNVESAAGPNTLADTGGDFGDTPGANGMDGRISFSFGINGGASTGNTLDERLQRIGGGNIGRLLGKSSQFNVTITIIVPDEDFAVLAQKTLQVDPVCGSFFGSHMITGRAIATSRCAGANSILVENPLVVHVTGVNCP